MSNKSVIVSFRLTESEYEPYRLAIEKTGLTRAKLFRNFFVEKGSDIKIKVNPKAKESPKVLFYANKASNNINQIARQLNMAHKTGELNTPMLNRAVIALESIEREFRKKAKGE